MKKIILMVILTGAVFSQNAEAQLQTMIDELDSIKKAFETQRLMSSPEWRKEKEAEIASRELTIRKFKDEMFEPLMDKDRIAIDMDSLIDDEEGLKHHPDTKELYSGKVIKFYEGNKKKEIEATFKDGKPKGPYTEWYQNGQKRQEVTYKDGKLDGLYTQWNVNGQKKREATFKDGELDGLMTEWNENGQKEIEGTFKDGNLITHPSPSYSSSSIVGYDWCTPNCNDPTSAFKFSSDGTFNFSTIMFGGMSRWGTWKDLGNNKIQTSDNQVGTQTITILSDTRIQVGSTVYVR